jgi:hypothetical protein
VTPKPTEGAGENPMVEPNQITASRDHELLRLLAQGCSDEEIASFLNVRLPIAKKYLQALFLGILIAKETTPGPERMTEQHGTEKSRSTAAAAREPKAVLYGMPCSKCHAYYSADVSPCPICKSPNRVSPHAVPALSVIPAILSPDPPAATSLTASCEPSRLVVGEQSQPAPALDRSPHSDSPPLKIAASAPRGGGQ